MDIAYLHLITNHIPIVGVPFALAILLIGIWRNSSEIKAVSFLIFAVLGLVTIAVFLLGQGGEDFVEDLAGVSHDAIEDHEGVAKFALGSVLLTAAAAVFALVRYGGLRLLGPRFGKTVDAGAETQPGAFPTWIVLSVLAIAVVSSGILGYTGRLGGKIRHPEFHGGAQTTEGEKNEAGETGEEDEEDGKGRGRNRGER